jgi:two-component sensor histidine kinase
MLPLGIILNELISNSLKHGFGGVSIKGNKVSVSLSKDKEFNLEYTDNGKGFVYDEINKSRSFGLDLIDTLTEDLDAQIKYESVPENGMAFHLTF